jgi:uncharacterized membrane protein YphA (DoxX/SURF4 family)
MGRMARFLAAVLAATTLIALAVAAAFADAAAQSTPAAS